MLKDVNGDRMGTWEHALNVPEFSDDKLSASTMILAGQMERVPAVRLLQRHPDLWHVPRDDGLPCLQYPLRYPRHIGRRRRQPL